jgi:anti-sigma factor RsiW
MEVVRCPADPDETVEAYLLGRLPEEHSAAFEEHFLGCPRCSERLQFTDDFIKAVRHAAERLRRAGAAAGA